MREAFVLIVSYPEDFHAKYLAEKLDRLGIGNLIFNLGEYPAGIESAVLLDNNKAQNTSFLFGANQIASQSITGVWWRRPLGAYRDEPETMREKYIGSESESYSRSIPYFIQSGATWVSDPEATRVASRKPYQLLVAQAVGWRIPRTFIGNSTTAAKTFLQETGAKNVVMKPVCSSFVRLNPKKEDSENLNAVIYARRILSSMVLDHLDQIPACPFILQEEIKKELDIRVTVVGDQVFSSAITATSDISQVEEIDWRHHKHQRHYEHHNLPTSISELCVAVTKRLGLCFGCIDLGFSRENGYSFFEINPQGQWLPSENIVGHNISGALIELLTKQI